MADVLSTDQRSFNMSRIRGYDTKPEMIVRRGLHSRGFRYRLHDRCLPGRPDLVFPKYRSVIFVNGCFWHAHDCGLFKMPATRREFWEDKLAGNRDRDQANREALVADGWRVATVWECGLRGKQKRPVSLIIEQCAAFLLSPSVVQVTVEGLTQRPCK